MLFRFEIQLRQLRILIQPFHQYVTLLLLFFRLRIDCPETLEYDLRRRNGKAILSCRDPDGRRLIPRRLHPARNETLPHQLIQTELIPAQRFFDCRRGTADIRRADRLMGVLDVLIPAAFCLAYRHIFFSEIRSDILPHILIRFFGYSGGVRTQIRDQSHRSVSLDINSLIQLLCDTHRLRRGKIQRFGRCLLQRTGSKRDRRFLHTLAFADIIYRIFF